jgi:hypothetical protein
MSQVSIRAGARFAFIAAFGVLTACGGGGGGSDDGGGSNPPPPPPPPPTGGGNTPTNRAPTFVVTTFNATEDLDLSAQVTANDADGDALTFTRTGDPTSGTVVSFTPAGAFVYRPNSNANGTDTFAVRVADPVGNEATATVTVNIAPVNDPPVAANDVLRADGPQLSAIDVLSNDRDLDGDALTITIEEAALAGTATVGADRKVRLEGLPAGFRGLTRFRYRITDGGGLFAVANAAVFVGTDPFRVVFAGEAGAANAPEVYMTDFVSPPWRATLATEGNRRLRGFAASDNGATVVYRREGGNATDLSFVRTTTSDSTADQQVRIALPSGYAPVTEDGTDQFAVSPDGQWIATVARGNDDDDYAVFAINVTAPMAVRNVTPQSTRFATQPRFSANSGRLYFLATDSNSGPGNNGRKSLFRLDLAGSSDTPVQLSRTYNGMNPGDINEFAVAPSESRIALEALRGGRLGVYFIDPSTPGTEVQINPTLGAFQALESSTVGLAARQGASTGLERIGFTVSQFLGAARSAYVAEVSATPNPRVVASDGTAVGFRPDNDAMLFSTSGQIYEGVIDSTAAAQLVGAGTSGVHDSVGDTIVLQQSNTLSVARRGSFGAPTAVGTPGQAAWFSDFSGAERAVLLIGEGPAGAAPRTVRLAFVNARAPDRLLALADFNTPIDLTSGEARIVTY